MLYLVTEDLQAACASDDGNTRRGGMLGQGHYLLSRPASIMTRREFMQRGCNRLDPSRHERLRTGVALEEPQSRRPTRISEDLYKFGKQHREQGVDLVFVACHLITQLTMQAHQLPIGGNQLCGDIAPTSFTAEQHSGNGTGIQGIRFCS